MFLKSLFFFLRIVSLDEIGGVIVSGKPIIKSMFSEPNLSSERSIALSTKELTRDLVFYGKKTVKINASA